MKIITTDLFQGAEIQKQKVKLLEKREQIQLVEKQAQEIKDLKDEISLLTRKGGHILPPAQPPLPQWTMHHL